MNQGMPTMTNSPQRLRALLDQQRDVSRELLQILAREHAALSGNDLQGLETILAVKQQNMDQLEALSRQFMELTRRHSPPHKDGMIASLRHCDPQGTWGLETLWRELEGLLTQCRDKNNTNGKIIALSHRQVQQALAILRNGELAGDSCYSPTGNRPAAASSRTLGKV